jgi:hypothetical protein
MRRRHVVLGLAALILAAAASPSPALASASPWWEKFTFTYDSGGTQRSCRYQTSLAIAPAAAACDTDEPDSPTAHQARASTGSYTKISIERRYTPGTQPEPVKLAAGDTLLGGQVMSLAIDGAGLVRSCRVVGETGDVKAPYGCTEARGERFEASASRAPQLRHGFMTVLIYGHEEYPV